MRKNDEKMFAKAWAVRGRQIATNKSSQQNYIWYSVTKMCDKDAEDSEIYQNGDDWIFHSIRKLATLQPASCTVGLMYSTIDELKNF